MIKYVLILNFICLNLFAQYQEASITRTTSTNSVFPRQFPSMTIRKMNENEYWIFESLGTNTIFHRQFPTYIVRKENYGYNHPSQKWGVYRTINTNSVFPRQFPDRYISSLNQETEYTNSQVIYNSNYNLKNIEIHNQISSDKGYTYTKSLKTDKTRVSVESE